jgi:hypothetical protein
VFGGDFLVGFVIHGVGINRRLKQNGLAVRAPLRGGGAGGNIGDAAGFAAVQQIENVDLRNFVAFALGGESDAVTVG